MKSNKRIVPAVIVMIAAGAMLLSGCTPNGAPPTNGSGSDGQVPSEAQTWEEMNADYGDVASELEIPEGKHFPDLVKPPADTLPDGSIADAVYEPGFGQSVAEMNWNCLWLGSWLEKRGEDEAAAAIALEKFASFEDSWTFQNLYDEGSQEYWSQLVPQMQLGDASGAQYNWPLWCADVDDQFDIP